jgi:predicted transcriptional regulator
MTIRAISVYLDLSETMIDKTVKQLISAGMITKTKVNRQNVYRLNDYMILKQPDIHHILAAINKIESSKKEIVQEQHVAEDELF